MQQMRGHFGGTEGVQVAGLEQKSFAIKEKRTRIILLIEEEWSHSTGYGVELKYQGLASSRRHQYPDINMEKFSFTKRLASVVLTVRVRVSNTN